VIDSQPDAPFADRRELVRQLTERGLQQAAAEQKADLFVRTARSLLVPGDARRDAKTVGFFVPGRIEILGKHTDYAGGRSMLVAADRGFCLAVRPRADDRVQVTDAVSGESVGFPMSPDVVARTGHWSNYPMTVARRVAGNFPSARRGADIAFASDLPPAAGMSSSSAMIVAVFLALAEANYLRTQADYPVFLRDPMQLAEYLGCVENGQSFLSLEGDRGVGTFGGSEDHTAILCAEPNTISQYAYCPVIFEQAYEVPQGHTFAIGTSGVVAEKTGAAREKYNRISRLATAIVKLWQRKAFRDDAHLAAVLRTAPGAADRLKRIVATATNEDPAALLARLEHFMIESGQIIPAAGQALAQGDLTRFGRLVDQSQRAAEELLGNQIPQTIYLAAAARKCGAAAASAFGAGFGGSVWAMVQKTHADSFLTAWADAYRQKFPQNSPASTFFLTAAGPAALRVC